MLEENGTIALDHRFIFEEDVCARETILLAREYRCLVLFAFARAKRKTNSKSRRNIRMRKVEILKLAKLPADVSSYYLVGGALPSRLHLPCCISVHFTLLLFLAPVLSVPFISHLAGYCDKRIARFSLRENVSLCCRMLFTRERKLQILNSRSFSSH